MLHKSSPLGLLVTHDLGCYRNWVNITKHVDKSIDQWPSPSIFLVGGPDSTFDPVCVFVCLCVQQIFVRQILNASLCWTNQTSTSANLLLSMLWLGIAASNSVTRKTTRLAFVTYNLTSSKLQRQKIIRMMTWWWTHRSPDLYDRVVIFCTDSVKVLFDYFFLLRIQQWEPNICLLSSWTCFPKLT